MSHEAQNELIGQSQSLKRQLALTWLLMLLLVVILILPTLKIWFNFGVTGDPRIVSPRGELADFEKTTVNLFRETSPSVVYINTQSQSFDPFRRRIVRGDSGTGSGFVWDAEGHIVTNYHVLQEASAAKVFFFDHSSYEAIPVGASPEHDLAVLRIKAPANLLRPVLIGESHELEVGQSVFAIGNPFGLDQTLTTGIVSAKSRTIESPSGTSIKDVIQIDAAINPGNSGGPLLDSAGRLIGVNTAIYSPSGASAGVGFAIPVDVVNRVVPQIIAQGSYEPPEHGIYTTDYDTRRAQLTLGIEGVMAVDVDENSPAAKAGVRGMQVIGNRWRPGDVILKVDEMRVRSKREFDDVWLNHRRGDKVMITFTRNNKIYETNLVLE